MLAIPQPDAPDGVAHIRQCARCGLRRLDPRPGPTAIGGYYAAAAGYNAHAGRRRSPRAQGIWNFLRDGFSAPAGAGLWSRLLRPLTRPLARWLFIINVALDGRRGLRVLEVGSGFGDVLIYLQSRGCEVLGTDLSPAAASMGSGYGVEVRTGNLADLALPGASFDVGIMCFSLEHVPDPNDEIAELARVLKPGAELHLAVPNGHAVGLAIEGLDWHQVSHPFHFWYFDVVTLTTLLRRHGFELVGEPVTTTRHHAWGAWWTNCRSGNFVAATRRLVRYLRESLRVRDGGDSIRLIAKLRG